MKQMVARGRYLHALPFFLLTLGSGHLFAQGVAGAVCKPVSQRTQEVGCWIMADDPIGQLAKSPMFWHLDVYTTRAAAEADRGPRGIVFDAFGKIWLMTIADRKWRSSHGTRAAEIGPLPIVAGENYSAQYMEAVFTPGMKAPAHIHAGPEAWYTMAGETCLETSDGGVQIGREGGRAVIVERGLMMHLTATGKEERH